MYGFWGKLLDVDLERNSFRVANLPQIVVRKFLGGRGLATWLLWRELGAKWESVDPLGCENLLLVLTGPLTGYYPGIKLTVSGKSPQSNGVVGSTVSSELAAELKSAGYDGILIRGISKDPVYLYIDDDKVELRDASKLWGKTSVELLKSLREELKVDYSREGANPWPATLYIGPAGENLARTAAVNARWTHGAGYGGYGAVMGSKKLKAIVVKGRGPLPPIANFNEFLRIRTQVSDILANRVHSFKLWGTPSEYYFAGNRKSSEPIKNWQEEWHSNIEFSHHELETRIWVKRYWSDWGCPLSCMKISLVNVEGDNYVTDGPDYEMGAYLGSNLGIFSPKEFTALSAMADLLGQCGIQVGNVMGLAFELYQRGILKKEDIGYELNWGDFKAALQLLKDISYRRGIGKILAEGTYRAALKIAEMKGIKPEEILRYAVQVKGIGIGAHGIRSRADYPQPIAYATGVQGGDHTSVSGLPVKSQASESWKAFLDSAVICMFNTIGIPEELVIGIWNAVTGWNLTKEELYDDLGPRILTLQRVLLLLGGPDVFWDPRVHDDNPPRFYDPLPAGPFAGAKADTREVSELKQKYYRDMGWDEMGLPTNNTLERLGLNELREPVDRIKRRLSAR
ncbi:MAG: aldehyde ferredoxin oxidoreductase C-terminal domain-containing protein [Desulfurococcaceae archaeon]